MSDHLLRTMAAVPPGERVLVRGMGGAQVAHPLAQMGFEVHAAPWTDAAARQVHEAQGSERENGEAADEGTAGKAQRARVYATGAPLQALPYPEGHFGWVVVVAATPEETPEADRRALLRPMLREARHHVRPGGWVFVVAPATEGEGNAAPARLGEAAEQAELVEAEAPEAERGQVRGIFRRVDEHTSP